MSIQRSNRKILSIPNPPRAAYRWIILILLAQVLTHVPGSLPRILDSFYPGPHVSMLNAVSSDSIPRALHPMPRDVGRAVEQDMKVRRTPALPLETPYEAPPHPTQLAPDCLREGVEILSGLVTRRTDPMIRECDEHTLSVAFETAE